MAAEILGTDITNILKDTAAAEILRGLGGNDTLISLTNFDTLYGGDGDDTLRLYQPSDAYLHVVAFGDAGNDLIRMMPGCDAANIFGGDGADTILGTGGRGYFTGGTGDDVITGGSRLTWETNRVLAYGDSGDDVMTGIWNAYGGDGADLMTGCRIASAGNGRDTVIGTVLDDILTDDSTDKLGNFFYGGGGSDQITGGGGIDWINGGSLHDTLRGGGGNDMLIGGTGSDLMSGGSGDDQLLGEIGNDTLTGESGNDRLYGGDNGDVLAGGAGRDVLSGGAGADVFLFSSATDAGTGASAEVILDFTTGEDRIKLAVGTLHFVGTDLFSKTAGEVRFESVLPRLQIDLDGNGVADMTLRLIGVTGLTAQDLIL